MKKIKIILSTISVVILLFSVILFTACNKGKTKYNDTTLIRPCDNVICLNGGTCKDGLCYCPQGFEGTKCATRWSDKFVGNYTADDACDTSSGYYGCIINPDAGYAYNKKKYYTYLNNRFLYSGGFGIDVLTLYDINLRFEYSFNQLGKSILFFGNK